jgi:hypothetical protein
LILSQVHLIVFVHLDPSMVTILHKEKATLLMLNPASSITYYYTGFFFGINHAVSWTLVQTNPRSHRVGPQRGKVLPKRGSP